MSQNRQRFFNMLISFYIDCVLFIVIKLLAHILGGKRLCRWLSELAQCVKSGAALTSFLSAFPFLVSEGSVVRLQCNDRLL
jgi:hypothetical protein